VTVAGFHRARWGSVGKQMTYPLGRAAAGIEGRSKMGKEELAGALQRYSAARRRTRARDSGAAPAPALWSQAGRITGPRRGRPDSSAPAPPTRHD